MTNETNNNGFTDRLKQIIAVAGIEKKVFARQCGISPNQLYNYLNGSQEPGTKFYRGLKTTIPSINIDWLITGQGSPNIKDNSISDVAHDADPEVALLLDMTRKIVKSDTSYAYSLMANIKSFYQAMTAEQKYQDLEDRLARIEHERIQTDRIREEDPQEQKEAILKKRAM